MIDRRWLVLTLLLVPVGCQTVSATVSEESVAPEVVAAARVEEYVRHLAADVMAGRDTGSRESLEAADYISRSFKASGLHPAGDDGTWLQDIGERGWTLTALEVELIGVDGETSALVHGVDYVFLGGAPSTGTYAIDVVASSDELPGPDADLSDRALLLDASAGGLEGRELMRSNFGLLRSLRAREPSGLALVLVASQPTAGEPRPVPERLVGDPDMATYLWLRGEALAAVRSGQATAAHLRLEGGEATAAVNVVGLLPGAGTAERPELADETVVFSAHYDHIGVLPKTTDNADEDDRIFNGANDDASGVATVMALAEAFGRGDPPARTLVFLAVTGEEKGLLGTLHYIDDPAVPLDRTVCNMNFEMVGMPDPAAGGPGRLFLTGFERSNLGAAWAAGGLPIVADPHPGQNYFQRSDNYPFAKQGIVAQTLSSGGGGDNPHYHQPSDEADTLDFEHMRAAVEACYRAARLVADGDLDPTWEPGGMP